jgi:hypothetical protein
MLDKAIDTKPLTTQYLHWEKISLTIDGKDAGGQFEILSNDIPI